MMPENVLLLLYFLDKSVALLSLQGELHPVSIEACTSQNMH